MGFSLKKSFRKVAGSKVSNAVSKVVNTKNLAIVAPYTAALTTGGRQALKNTYGGIAGGLVNSYTGGAGGGIFQGALDAVTGGSSAPAEGGAPIDSTGGSFFGGGGQGAGYAAAGYAPRGQPPAWVWAVAAGAVVIVAVILFRKR